MGILGFFQGFWSPAPCLRDTPTADDWPPGCLDQGQPFKGGELHLES
ncbi:hypothetical protein J2790_002033 [Paenarthrobacter nicotinovorans]|uniref:Uncharacterized protein n=1 Tax=Paenarthrobacter nicotinovorans TaxID=29320 RepID=A0ABV0GN77_PAENI|nr:MULTISPECIES: hypothetical protein [Micrococcaceae]MDR6436890.1 hypothetical protein [Paenarthrobacter nicotinovorans]SCZ55379.1 hypothetical protein SAMN02799638_01730 [Arthrobacter sp. UNCCL28]